MLAFGNSYLMARLVLLLLLLFGDCFCEAWFLLGGLVHQRVRTRSWLIPALNWPFRVVINPFPDRLLRYGSETRRFTVNEFFVEIWLV